MKRRRKILAAICALALIVNVFGVRVNDVAASLPVTSDDAALSQAVMERGAAKSPDTNTNVQQLKSGKKVQGRLVSGDDGQQYQITLKSSGQLDISLEGDAGKLSTRLTDKDGKGWAPRRRTANGKQTYQLKKGTYRYQVQAAKGAEIPGTGLNYAVTATFRSAKVKFENNTTRKKAAKLPLKKVFYGHLAQNAPTEYFKITLKKLSCVTFSINTQMRDDTPETFVVTLYNKYGKRMLEWENPDWVKYEKVSEEMGAVGNWMWDDYGDWQGLQANLEAGSYYVGVSVKRNEDGKVPSSARYGLYAVCAHVSGLGVTLDLSPKQAEYTGKKIKSPRVSMNEYPEDPYYEFWAPYDVKEFADNIRSMQTGHRVSSIKEIGRYQIGCDQETAQYHPGGIHAYAIFTVIPIRGKISRVSSRNPGEIQVSVKKNAQSTGYQIQMAQDKKFKKSVRTLKTTNLGETIKGLPSGKKYYVRVRNYKDVKTYYCGIAVPESIYGKWSRTKTVVCR